MRNYNEFPVPTEFRDKLILQLGLITVAQAAPDVYEEKLDELRAATEASIRPEEQ